MNTNHDALREALELLRIFKNNLGPDRASLSAEDAILWDRVEALSQPMPEGAKPEREIEQLIRERDQRDEIIDRLCDAVLGSERPEWSSAYGFDDAVADVEARITQLHQPSVDKAWKRFEQANAAQPPHPQPQAQGEPNKINWVDYARVEQSHREALAKLEYGPLGKKFYEELSYSLQSERDDAINKADTLSEAIAKKDAALDACVEAAAKAIYEQWESHSGYVAWVEGGNSLMQEAARSIARAAITKIKEARG